MFLYIPYGTDAPIYYRPYITVAMIVINVLIFIQFSPGQIEPYRLAMGDGLHPIQWLTANFLHADVGHLIFNMLFLWVFGLVIEGKIGTLKMLALYLGMAISYGAMVQIITLGSEPNYRLGSSAVVYGLAVMSFIWAPENKIYGFFAYWIILRGGAKDLETDISLAVGFFAVLSVLWACFFGRGFIGELGHIIGALLGIIIALTMIKMNWVDCEYGDIISVWTGAKERAEVEASRPEKIERQKESEEEQEKRQNLLIAEISRAIENQMPMPAYVIMQRTEKEFVDWTLPQELHLTLIQQLLSGKHWDESIAVMRLYLERHQEQSVFVHLMLTQTLITQNQPKSAIEVLDSIPPDGIPPEMQSAVSKIRSKAETLYKKLEGDIYELDVTK